MYFPIPSDERLFLDQSMPDRLVVTGLEATLDANSAIRGRQLIVRATTVRIVGHVRLPGGVIDIFARRVIAEGDAFLDVSGAVGDPDFTGRAPARSGANPGENGLHGENGGDGGHGGRVFLATSHLEGRLRISANGGPGGAAQWGGAGMTGAQGHDHRECGPAQAGGQGGAGGRAGRPGRGGDGGQVKVSILHPVDEDALVITAEPGPPGAPGQHGRPGAGGPGGRGGSVYDFEPDWIRDSRFL